jgi:hypothetical protein
VGSAVEADLSAWPDYDGEIPELGKGEAPEFLQAVIHNLQKWDNGKDDEVPDLLAL